LKRLGAALLVALLLAGNVHALPQGQTVLHGNASFQWTETTLDVFLSPSVIIEWQSFSLLPNEMVRFVAAPGSGVLNRVVGDGSSTVSGSFMASANVAIVNPKGIAVGSESAFSVGDLMISAVQVENGDFLIQAHDFQRFTYQWDEAAGAVSFENVSIDLGANTLHVAGIVIEFAGVSSFSAAAIYLDGDTVISPASGSLPVGIRPPLLSPGLNPGILSPVPEPANLLLLCFGFALLLLRYAPRSGPNP